MASMYYADNEDKENLDTVPEIMGNNAFKSCASKDGRPRKRRRNRQPKATDSENGITPPFPALEVLRADVTTAQNWLDFSLAQLKRLELPNDGKPPDERKKRKNLEKLKELAKDFLKKSFETDELLGHSHAWLDKDNYQDTTFDLEIAKLEYSWSEVRDKLTSLASEYNCEQLQADLAKDLSAQGGDGFAPAEPSSVYIPRSRLVNRRRTNPDGTQGHQPKQKRRFIPHLTWQYRAVIKSHVKLKDRTPRSSILGSEVASDVGSIYSEPQSTPRRLGATDSSSFLSLPSGDLGFTSSSSTSLPTLCDAERRVQFKPGYKDNPSSDSLVSRDLNSNTVRVKEHIRAIRNRQRQPKQPSNLLSLVRYASDSSGDTKEVYVDLSAPAIPRQDSNSSADTVQEMDDWTKVKESRVPDVDTLSSDSGYPVKSKFGRMTRSVGIHEGLTSLASPSSRPGSGKSTPTRSHLHLGKVRTPGGQFAPGDVSTPVQADVARPGVSNCPQTPVEIRRFLGTNNSGAGRLSPDSNLTGEFSDNSSNLSSLAHSPTNESRTSIRKDLKRKYEKDELWRAIKSDYHYLMDEDIIEQCRSTDSDLSWDDEEVKNAVTFTDFIQQYNELMEWLNQIQMFTQRQGSSLSEKYLNQSYYEEMLDRSPRKKLFNDYAKQLMRRYPNMKDEIVVRLTHLNNQWERLQKAMAPSDGLRDRDTMIRDLALDLRGLETWVNRIERTLQPRALNSSLSLQELRDMLKEHQVLQQDIECHSKVVSAVLKLCERLHKDDDSVSSPSEELQITALNLERRWHSIWLQSLEWQCRLEEALNTRTSLLGRSLGESHIRVQDSTVEQSDSRLEVSSDESEGQGHHNDHSSVISETSNAQTVTHDRATSPGTSTLGRPKKDKSTAVNTLPLSARQPEIDSSQNYLELPDPDTHILVVEPDQREDDYQLTTASIEKGKIRHWSDSAPLAQPALVSRQSSRDRRRRYSDSAHITVDSPTEELSPLLRSKSLDDIRKLEQLATASSGSLDKLSEDSGELFDETAALLQSVASELTKTYESFDDVPDDDDEFFLCTSSERATRNLLATYSTEAGLESVIEEESEGEMASPRGSQSSQGERVFASPKVKKILQLQSFSNTISPATSPPAGRSDSSFETGSEAHVEEGALGLQDGRLVVENNVQLSEDLNDLPGHALHSLTATQLSSNAAFSNLKRASNTVLQRNCVLYRREEYDARLRLLVSRKQEVTAADNLDVPAFNSSDEYCYESSASSSTYGDNKFSRLRAGGSLQLNKYAHHDDLSKIADSPLTSDMEDGGRSLSPSNASGLDSEVLLTVQPGMPEERKVKQLRRSQGRVKVEPSSTSTILVSVDSNARENASHDTFTSLKTSAPTSLVTQVDLTDMTETTHLLKARTGPRSISVSGSSEPLNKYRKLDLKACGQKVKDVPPKFVSVVTDIPSSSRKLRAQTLTSPAELISRGFTLAHRDDSATFNQPFSGAVISTPIRRLRATTDGDLRRVEPRSLSFTDSDSTHTDVFSVPSADGVDNSSMSGMWESGVTHPSNRTIMNIEHHKLEYHHKADDIASPQEPSTPSSSRKSSESYAAGYLTPTRSYLKVTSVDTPVDKSLDYSETIYINPSEATKAVQQASAIPSDSASLPADRKLPPVQGIEQITTTIKPAAAFNNQHLNELSQATPSGSTTPNSSSGHSVRSQPGKQQRLSAPAQLASNISLRESAEGTVATPTEGTVATPTELSQYQKEFTTVSLTRPPEERPSSLLSSPKPEPTYRYTAEANLDFLRGERLSHEEESAAGKFVGSHRPAQGESDEEKVESQPKTSKQPLVLNRKTSRKHLGDQENTTPTSLVFTTESIDNSGEAGDADLESRKAKTGTVYRILDDGNVVRECDLDKHPLSPAPVSDDESTKSTDNHVPSVADTNVTESDNFNNDLSNNRAKELIQNLTSDSETSLGGHETPASTDKPASFEENLKPPNSADVGKPFSAVDVRKPSSPVDVREPSSPVDVSETSSAVDVREPCSAVDVSEPCSAVGVKEPSSSVDVSEPSSSVDVSEPSSPVDFSEPSSSVDAKEPSSSVDVSGLSSSVDVREPSSPVDVREPSSPVDVREPSSPVDVKGLSSSVDVREPSSPVDVREPSSPVDVKEPSSSVDVREPSSPVDVREPSSPVDVSGPSSSVDVSGLSSSVDGREPSSPVGVKEPSSAVDVSEPSSAVDVSGPSSSVDGREPSSPVGVKEPSSAVDVSKPSSAVDVSGPSSSVDGRKPSSPVGVKEPSSSVDVRGPSSAVDISEPSSSVDVKEPSSAVDVKEPSSFVDVSGLSSSVDVKEPSSSVDVRGPSSAVDISEPSSSVDVKEPSSAVDANEPFSSVDVREPSCSVDVKEPSSSVDVKEPSSAVDVKEPCNSVDVREPSSTVDVSGPSSSVNVKEPSSAVDVKESSSSVDVREPSSAVDVSGPSSSVDVKEPFSAVDVEEPSSPVDVREPSSPVDVSEPSSPVDVSEPSSSVDVDERSSSVCVTKPTEDYSKQSTSEKNLSAKDGTLANFEADDNKNAGNDAVALYDLITAMSPPDAAEDVVHPIDLLATPSGADEQVPISSSIDTSPDEVTTERPLSDSDMVFRPISQSPECDSETFSDEERVEKHSTSELNPPSGQMADCTFQPIQPVIRALYNPTEVCADPIICPQVTKAQKQDAQQNQALVAELQSPLVSGGVFESPHKASSSDGHPALGTKHTNDQDTGYVDTTSVAADDVVLPTAVTKAELPDPATDSQLLFASVNVIDKPPESVEDVVHGSVDAAEEDTASLSQEGCAAFPLPVMPPVPEGPPVEGVSSLDDTLVSSNPTQLLVNQAVTAATSLSDSDAFDGDASSEGEDASSDFHWRVTEQKQQGLARKPSPTADGFERESSVDTVRNAADASKESPSSDQQMKSTPSKRRRKRRPKTLTGSPKPQVGSPVHAFPTLKDPSTSKLSPQNSPDKSPVVSDNEDLSDVASSDNMNSAGLSEGSNWDYYQATKQDPPYSTSTDPEFDIDLEPKLDDSVLQWDDELNDSDTLNVDTHPRDKRQHAGGAAAASTASDSEDSDIEDLHYVIQQSSTQLVQADSALRKPRKAVVQSGIYLDPQKYVEWHATCQTNVKCLQVIQEHLESEQGLPNLTDDDIQQVLDLIRKWQSLEKVALERKAQSATLCKIYADIQAGQKLVKLSEEELAVTAFNDVGELETHFRSLQTFKLNLQSQSHRLQQVMDSVLIFESENKKIKMGGFKQLLVDLKASIKPTVLSVGKKTTELQYAIVQWHKWNSDCKELETVLVKTLYDIEPAELSLCEQRLVELEASFSEFSAVCAVPAHNYTEEKLAALRTRLDHLVAENGPVPDENVGENEEVREETPVFVEQESGMCSERSPPPLSLGSHKSSMESGIATMDTERSNEEACHTTIHTDSCDVKEVGVESKTTKDEVDVSFVSIDHETAAVDTTLSPVPVDTSVELRDSLGPLSVDVNSGHDMTSDHQTPPTVEDLAATLPITDQQKLHVANQSKRNKKKRRKGKNKNKAGGESTAEPSMSSNQSTLMAPAAVNNVSFQTETKSFANSFTNTASNELPVSAGLGTCTDPSVMTDLNDQLTGTEEACVRVVGTQAGPSTDSAASQTDTIPGVSFDDSYSQTDDYVDAGGETIPAGMSPSLSLQGPDENVDQGGSLPTSTGPPLLQGAQALLEDGLPSLVDEEMSLAANQLQQPAVPGEPVPLDDGLPPEVDELMLSAASRIHQQPAASGDQVSLDDVLPPEVDEEMPLVANQLHERPATDDEDGGPLAKAHELLTDNEWIVDGDEDGVPVHEELVKAEAVLRQRRLRDEKLAEGKLPVVDEPVPKPRKMARWFTRRTLKYMAAVIGSLLFIIILIFLLEPRCCENTRYHKGIFGLRRKYTGLPPH